MEFFVEFGKGLSLCVELGSCLVDAFGGIGKRGSLVFEFLIQSGGYSIFGEGLGIDGGGSPMIACLFQSQWFCLFGLKMSLGIGVGFFEGGKGVLLTLEIGLGGGDLGLGIGYRFGSGC